jgi:tetratricopeptide (TPR) repeat protein
MSSLSWVRVRRAPRAALCALALSLGACQGMPDMPMNEAAEKAKDEAAKADFYETSALTYYDGGKYEASARMWEKVLEQNPNDQKAKWGLAKSLQMIGTQQSLRRAEAILLPILNLEWHHPEIGDRSHEVKGTLAMVYQDLADLYDRDIRILQEKLRAIEEQENPAAQGDTSELRQQIQTQIAKRNDLLAKAIPLWEESIKVRSDHVYALAGLGKAYLMLGNDEKGIEYSRRYIMVVRASQNEKRKLRAEWEQRQAREGGSVTEEQRQIFVQKIQELRDNELKVHLLLGSVHMRREEFALAVDEYSAVLEIDPATPAALVERAQAQAKMGKFPLAVKDLEDYLKLTDPQRQRAARTRAAELLNTYRQMAGMSPILGPAAAGPGNALPSPATPKPTPSGPPAFPAAR